MPIQLASCVWAAFGKWNICTHWLSRNIVNSSRYWNMWHDTYNYIGFTRAQSKGGGIFSYIYIAFSTAWSQLNIGGFYMECHFVEIKWNDQSHSIDVLYRPPNINIVEFNSILQCIPINERQQDCGLSSDFYVDMFLKHAKHPPVGPFRDIYDNAYIHLLHLATQVAGETR